ncbi:MAG: hypothetical protein U9R32_05740 [Bacteroidota bacterium]|nr:hypothetical protein [Bacteroidota bacterium]
MKNLKLTTLLLATVFLFIATSCAKNKNELPVEFKFRLLDTLGNEKTVFNQGENMIFSFQVINHSSKNLMLENFFPNDDFFRVYQPNINEGTLNYGIPYEAFVLIEYFSILQNDTLKIEYPWEAGVLWNEKYPILSNESDNLDLPIGSFYTEFSQSFKIGDIQTETKDFRINFTIE